MGQTAGLAVLPDSAWVLLNKIDQPFFTSLYRLQIQRIPVRYLISLVRERRNTVYVEYNKRRLVHYLNENNDCEIVAGKVNVFFALGMLNVTLQGRNSIALLKSQQTFQQDFQQSF